MATEMADRPSRIPSAIANKGAYLLVAPAAAIFAALFVAPFVYFFVISFWSVRLYKLLPTFTLHNYIRTVVDYGNTLVLTIGLALTVAILTMLLGFVYAYVIRFKAGRWAPFFLFAAMITLFGGYLMKIYAWKTILGNEGVLNTALLSLGIIGSPITAFFYTPAAVIVTLVHFLLPFAILPIYSSLRGVDDIELDAARDLGARPVQVLRDIVLPRCRAGLMGAFVLCFLVSVGDYVTPLLVGGTITLMGNLIVPEFGNFFNWPLGSAMSFATLFVAVAIIGLANVVLNRLKGR